MKKKKITLGTKLGREYLRFYEMLTVSMLLHYILRLSLEEKLDVREIMLNVMWQLDTCLDCKGEED